MNRELELYLHIPFCIKKCAYCDFLSGPADKAKMRSYFEALIREIRACGDFPEYVVTSVFLGGGTPSVLPGQWIEQIMDEVKNHFKIHPEAEITTEANPGTVDKEKMECYRRAGFNRISFGCQSTDDQELRKLGRIHTWKDFLEGYQLARETGFQNINVDLMSGLPGQNVASWEKSLKRVAELGAEHISAYSLILEEGTPFYDMQDQLDLPDEESERQMYERTAEILKKYDFEQYEISNYARPGYACRHNIGYWTGREYLGLGLGASSLIKNCRFHNTSDMELYVREMLQSERAPKIHRQDAGKFSEEACDPEYKKVEDRNLKQRNGGYDNLRCRNTDGMKLRHIREDIQNLSEQDRIEEFMILGLRMTDGVSEREFEKLFHIKIDQVYGEILKKYCLGGFLKRERGRIFFSREGISVSNTILAEMLL